ncbi:MAG: hypothetical protein HJJLKODD_02678 [Phycisphaerae bacterium]|nr:hypothetical protein [Phycisphaerae bacterium]
MIYGRILFVHPDHREPYTVHQLEPILKNLGLERWKNQRMKCVLCRKLTNGLHLWIPPIPQLAGFPEPYEACTWGIIYALCNEHDHSDLTQVMIESVISPNAGNDHLISSRIVNVIPIAEAKVAEVV